LRTTISIKDELMNSLISRTKTRSRSKAVEIAIRDYIEKKSVEDLIALSGKVTIDLDWQKEEETELNEYKDHC
jgi:metal-responsive CopG/Arc/MetJ family transcriptional regulator